MEFTAVFTCQLEDLNGKSPGHNWGFRQNFKTITRKKPRSFDRGFSIGAFKFIRFRQLISLH